MDVDISDILADISRPTQDPSASLSSTAYTDYDGTTAYTDHMALTRAWTAERCTPTLLPYPTTLISRTMDRVRAQISRIEDLTAGVYEAHNTAPTQPNLNLVLSILQTDLSRTQFLLRSFLRQRLAKISRHATYYAKYHASPGEGRGRELLSHEEVQFLQHHQGLLAGLYESSFLMSLPQSLRRLDDRTGAARMDEGPDAAGGVLVQCLAREWTNENELFDEDEIESSQQEEERATVELRLERGGILVARWRDVRRGVEKGDLQVL